MDERERSVWGLITTPLQAIHDLREKYGITTIGQLCELTENELAGMLDRHGVMGVRRDLQAKGLSLRGKRG